MVPIAIVACSSSFIGCRNESDSSSPHASVVDLGVGSDARGTVVSNTLHPVEQDGFHIDS